MLPYGLQKRVELGRALALKPEIILLDEPLAGLNLEEVEDMARFILDINEAEHWKVTCVLVEHDMGVVMDISDRVFVLNFGVPIMDGLPMRCRTTPMSSRLISARKIFMPPGDRRRISEPAGA